MVPHAYRVSLEHCMHMNLCEMIYVWLGDCCDVIELRELHEWCEWYESCKWCELYALDELNALCGLCALCAYKWRWIYSYIL